MFCFESVYHYPEMHFMYLMECFFFAFIFYIGNMLFEGTFSMNFFLDKKMLWKKFYIALKLSQFQKASIFTLFKVLTFIYIFFSYTKTDMECWTYLQIAFPRLLVIHLAPGPQGDGLQGSGFSTQRWPSQTYPDLQSGSITHSGPQPVIVSGLGINPGLHLETKVCRLMIDG